MIVIALPFFLLSSAIQADAVAVRMVYSCEVREVRGNPPTLTDQPPRRIVFLLDDDEKRSPLKTLDPAGLLHGASVKQYLVTTKDSEPVLVGLTGDTLESARSVVIYPAKSEKVWNVAISTGGTVEHSGFCFGVKKATTASDAETFASKWFTFK